MGPVRDGGRRPTASVVLVTLCLAVLVAAIVSIGGGFQHPIVTAMSAVPARTIGG